MGWCKWCELGGAATAENKRVVGWLLLRQQEAVVRHDEETRDRDTRVVDPSANARARSKSIVMVVARMMGKMPMVDYQLGPAQAATSQRGRTTMPESVRQPRIKKSLNG